MRIVIFNGDLSPSTFIHHLCEGLGKKHDVLLAGKGAPDGHRGYSEVSTGSSWIPMQLLMLWVSFVILLLKSPSLALAFLERARLAKGGRGLRCQKLLTWCRLSVLEPEILHVQWAAHLNLFEEVLDLFPAKVVVSLRGRLVNISPFVDDEVANLYRECFPKVGAFHAVSRDLANNAALFGADLSKTKVIPGAVDESYLQKPGSKKELNSRAKLCCVGREHWIKGYPLLLRAVKILKERKRDVELTLIGTGKAEELVYLIDDLDLTDEVNLVQTLPQEEVLVECSKHDIFVLPSIKEGIANVVLEAMACGIPVISSDCGGMTEVIEHEVNGWITPLRDERAMANQIEAVMDMAPAEIEKICEKAHQTILDHHVKSKQIARFDELYAETLS